jgi:2-isopropylmalate synthase
MATRTRTGEPAWAQVELLERGIEIPLAAEGHGDGPIDAALRAVVAALAIEARLVAFSVEALSTGADALAEAHVTVDVGGRHHTAEGVAPSLTEAGVRAFLRALSHARRAERHA